jgi:hypothetical protein
MNNNLNYINKYFYIEDTPQKITKVTAKTIFYKSCSLDNCLSVNVGAIFNSHFENYYYYSNIIDQHATEKKILKEKFHNFGYLLRNDIDHNRYNYNETGYFTTLFFTNKTLLEKIYKIKYELMSLKMLGHQFVVYYENRTTDDNNNEAQFYNDCKRYYIETKQNIDRILKNDEDDILIELLKYDTNLMNK